MDDPDSIAHNGNADEQAATPKQLPAHVRNLDIPASWRYGLVLWLVATLVLLVTSDVGSGVRALTQTVPRAGLNFQSEEQVLLEASVFTSVGELWEAGSKPLSIFIVITSISWPYIKLLLTMYAWVAPMRNATRREYLLIALDLFGKWSFADVVVFTVIVVVFRKTIPIGAGFLEVWIQPQWGLYGFISASMLSLMATHAVLHLHRRVLYGPAMQVAETDRSTVASHMSTPSQLLSTLFLVISFAVYLTGIILHFFHVSNIQQGSVRDTDDYSLTSVGRDLPDAKRDDEPAGGLVYLQVVWFLLGVAIPLLLVVLSMVLLYAPLTMAALRRWLLVTEVAASWSCAEVFLISIVLAIREIPTFGDGLIDTGCSQCYRVSTEFDAAGTTAFAVGTVTCMGAVLVILKAAHGVAYRKRAMTSHHDDPHRDDDEAS